MSVYSSFKCFWSNDSSFCLVVTQRPRHLLFSGFTIPWGFFMFPSIGSSASNRWGGKHRGSFLGGFYGQVFDPQNSQTWIYGTSKEAGKHCLSVCQVVKEKWFGERLASLRYTFRRVLATRTRKYIWVNWALWWQ